MASTIVVSLAKQNGSFGIRLSEQGVVTGYGIAGGAAEAAGLAVGARIVAVQGKINGHPPSTPTTRPSQPAAWLAL
jgi:predicted metalloprotease with PDZ domain